MMVAYIAQLSSEICQKENESKKLGRYLYIGCPQVESKLPHKSWTLSLKLALATPHFHVLFPPLLNLKPFC